VVRFVQIFCGGLFVAAAVSLGAAVYEVGPGREHVRLQSVAPLLRPGDVVEVMGGAIYPGDVRLDVSGTAEQPIVIRGVPVGGRRPVISGVQGREAAVVRVSGDYYVLEDLEITGGGDTNATRGVRNVGHGSVLRRVAVYDVAGLGVLNSDAAGSLTLSRVTVARCGQGEAFHQVYIGMDVQKHPEGVFRMEFCHVLDGRGGNNIKSRARRTELFYNWVEGAWGRELELLGPDRHGRAGEGGAGVRCDAVVVGNVFYKSGGVAVSAVRVGGDGSGTSRGRAQFVHNTFVLSAEAGRAGVFKLQDVLEGLEVYYCVFYGGGRPLRMLYDPGLRYESAGAFNWVPAGSTHLPRGWKQTLTGREPGFAGAVRGDWRPLRESALVRRAGVADTGLPRPLFEPAREADRETFKLRRRSAEGPLAIGALDVDGER